MAFPIIEEVCDYIILHRIYEIARKNVQAAEKKEATNTDFRGIFKKYYGNAKKNELKQFLISGPFAQICIIFSKSLVYTIQLKNMKESQIDKNPALVVF